MEFINIIPESQLILAAASVFALTSWVCSNALKIRNFLSKKHNLELIKLKLDINQTFYSLYKSDALPYELTEIKSDIEHSQQHTPLEKILFRGTAYIMKALDILCINIFRVFIAISLINVPLVFFGNEHISLYQAVTIDFALIISAFGFKQLSNLFGTACKSIDKHLS